MDTNFLRKINKKSIESKKIFNIIFTKEFIPIDSSFLKEIGRFSLIFFICNEKQIPFLSDYSRHYFKH